MSKFLTAIRNLVGNGKAATIGIGVFILVLTLVFFRCSPANGAEVDIAGGSSFGAEGYGAVLGLNLKQTITPNKNLYVNFGTDLWGATTYQGQFVPNNWDWHAELESCVGRFCAGIGPAYVQRVDAINGAHTDYYLGLSFKVSDRFRIVLGHISDAGTSNPNVGRQALTVSYRLQ
jgi:hypothetical protein